MTKEEAIKILSERYSSALFSERTALETLIPELKEIGDENIRQGIVETIKQCTDILDSKIQKRMLDWLEKQNNLMKALQISNARIGELIEENYYLKEQLEKQKEQKDFQAKVKQRMEYLWDKLPDANRVNKGNCTPEEWKTLGAYMELEMNFDKDSEEQKEQKPAMSREEIIYQLFQNGSIALSDYLYLTGEHKQDWSEGDERMRKAIIESLPKYGYLPQTSIKVEDAIAYLEKQKEQKPAGWKPQPESLEALMYAIEGKWEMIKPTSYLSRRLKDLYEGLVNTYRVDESLVTELHKAASEEDIEALKELKRKIDASMGKPVEKPTEWSEEDKHRCKDAIYFLETAKKHYADTSEIELTIDWLKSLRPQPKNEWSEDDKRMLNVAIKSCKQTIEDYPNDKVRFKDCIAWLKSLRPQSLARQARSKWEH